MTEKIEKIRKEAEKEKEYFLRVIDQHKVDNITVDFFYRSHTISLLVIVFICLLYFAFTRTQYSWQENYFQGAVTVCALFLMLSTMILPNGPFTRPHPAIWRIIFGASLLYFLMLVFVLFMRYEDARAVLHYIDSNLKNMTLSDILDKDYAVNCSQVTWNRIYSYLDVFAFAHFFGWLVKAILLRHYWLTWLLSINWEITELAFCHIMPNFCECWWDSIFLDVIVCNGVGIYVGMKIVQWLEMRTYHWESVRKIQSTTGKIKRIVLQFTPASWTPTCWLNSDNGIKRGVLLSTLVVVWQFAELNAFFLKQVFIVKPSHFLTIGRLGLITLVSAPGIRQFYLFVADPKITRIGSQLWMFLAIVMTEFLVFLKFGFEVFENTIIVYIILWIIWMILSSFATVFLCLWFTHSFNTQKVLSGTTPPSSPILIRRDLFRNIFMHRMSKTFKLIKNGRKYQVQPVADSTIAVDHNYQLYSERTDGAGGEDYDEEEELAVEVDFDKHVVCNEGEVIQRHKSD